MGLKETSEKSEEGDGWDDFEEGVA